NSDGGAVLVIDPRMVRDGPHNPSTGGFGSFNHSAIALLTDGVCSDEARANGSASGYLRCGTKPPIHDEVSALREIVCVHMTQRIHITASERFAHRRPANVRRVSDNEVGLRPRRDTGIFMNEIWPPRVRVRNSLAGNRMRKARG